MTKYTNVSDCNTGEYNVGRHNTGDWNTGHCNTGNRNTSNYNTGNYNTGYYNTGNHNTGNRNVGNRNTGNRNTGHCNTGNYHAGCFNTINAEKAYYFNTLIDKWLWDNAVKPSWLFRPHPTMWVISADMTDQEKSDNPSHEVTGGYLRKNDIKEEWRKAYENASAEDIQLVRDLPAFDYDVFEEITGLDLREKPQAASCEGREVEIDGLTYVLKLKGQDDETS